MPDQSKLDITIADAVIGATCTGIDLAEPMDDETFETIETLFNDRSVLCLRDQNLTESEFIEFAKQFGAIEKLYMSDYADPAHPEILLVSNIKQDGKDFGHADAGRVWHTDMSFTQRPPRATMLYAREVPIRDGVALGATDFASAAAAYDALPEGTQRRIDNLFVEHDVVGRRAETGTHGQQDERRRKQPTVTHPFVRHHPQTGRKCLYVSPGECTGIPRMPAVEALPLIEEMATLITRPRFQYRHDWRVGDVLIWDNCAVQHRATFDYTWPEERRLMWRVTVGGTIPV